MAELYMDSEADDALRRLDADPAHTSMAVAVNRVLDKLEADPGDREVRKHRFTIGLWCITVVVDEDEWVVLWESHPDDPNGVMVQYLGPASFS